MAGVYPQEGQATTPMGLDRVQHRTIAADDDNGTGLLHIAGDKRAQALREGMRSRIAIVLADEDLRRRRQTQPGLRARLDRTIQTPTTNIRGDLRGGEVVDVLPLKNTLTHDTAGDVGADGDHDGAVRRRRFGAGGDNDGQRGALMKPTTLLLQGVVLDNVKNLITVGDEFSLQLR